MIKLKNNTKSVSKIGYAVIIDPLDNNAFVYAPLSSTKVLGIITEQVPYRALCNIATSGERANVYISGSITKGSSIRLSKANDRISFGSCITAKTGDSPYLKIGSALTNGRGLVPCVLELFYQGNEDSGYVPYIGATEDVDLGSYGLITSDIHAGGSANYVNIDSSGNMTFEGDATVWDDLRITPGSFDRPGSSDPAYVLYYPNAGGIGVYLPEFAKNNIASFTIQLPHSYKHGSNIYVHIHWTPGSRGNEENGKVVAWTIDYTWANINSNFPDMQTLDLSDACDGTDHKHQMTSEVSINGSGKTISSMLLCNIRRIATGDTWAGTLSGQLPLLTEIDFHYELDMVGSKQQSAK